MFQPLTLYCKKKNVHYEEVIIEDDDIIQGIADYVLKNNIDVLVLGAGSRGGFFRRLRGPYIASKIAKRAPYFCTVYTIGKGDVVSIKSASTSAQSLSTLNSTTIQEPEIGNHVQSVNSQMEHRISVSAGDSLLPPRPVNEFEFRSPLKNYGGSDFSWEGHPPPDSDISFISSDREFFDRASSSYSTNSSNFSLGSFDSWQTSSSTSGLAIAMPSARTSDASYSFQYTMDELRRLQLELMQTKKIYEAACQEALDAEMQASEMKPHDLEDGDEMNRMQGSAVTLAKLENDKDETAARITDITKRIAELKAQQTC